MLLATLDNSLPGVRLISALAVEDDEAVFDPRRFEMAVEVVSGFTPNSLRIFSLTSSAAAEASSSQSDSEQRGLGFAAEASDVEAAISEGCEVSLVEAAAFFSLPFPARFKSLRFAGFPFGE